MDVSHPSGTGEGRWGGAITAAKLLERFVDDVPWSHIDIAGPALAEKPLSWLDGVGTGVMVGTLGRSRSPLARPVACPMRHGKYAAAVGDFHRWRFYTGAC